MQSCLGFFAQSSLQAEVIIKYCQYTRQFDVKQTKSAVQFNPPLSTIPPFAMKRKILLRSQFYALAMSKSSRSAI